MEDLVDHSLGGCQVRRECTEDQHAGEGVQQRGAAANDCHGCDPDLTDLQRLAAFDRQRLGQGQRPHRDCDTEDRADHERAAPRHELDQTGAERRGDDRNDDEHGHGEGHLARHVGADESVADGRHRDHPQPGRAEPPGETGPQHPMQARHQCRGERTTDEQRACRQQHPSPPKAVSQEAERDRPDGHAEEEGSDQASRRSRIGHEAEVGADATEGRQDQVDRDRRGRQRQTGERSQFEAPRLPMRPKGRGRYLQSHGRWIETSLVMQSSARTDRGRRRRRRSRRSWSWPVPPTRPRRSRCRLERGD
jgi:hypothetical protein